MDYDLSRSLFSINGKSFNCSDFLEALDFYGILEQWKAQAAHGNACVKSAAEKSLEADADILQRWAREFRYDHNLLSMEECTSWLKSIGLERQDFENHLLRRYWSSRLSEEVKEEGDFTERDIFAELYFNSSFNSLIDSWQKRLLAWVDSGGGDFPVLKEIERKFESYCIETRKLLDKEAWIAMNQLHLTRVSLSCIPVENEEDLAKASSEESIEDAFPVNGFLEDLPEAVMDIIDVNSKDLQGPVLVNEFNIVFKVTECVHPQSISEEVEEIIDRAFFSEVWKTLKVKYVRS